MTPAASRHRGKPRRDLATDIAELREPLANNTPKYFAAFIGSEAAKYAKAVKDSGAKVD